MYTMVLAATLAGGTAAPDFGRHGGHGCYGGYGGGYGCAGCFGCAGLSGYGPQGPTYVGYTGYPAYVNQGGYGCGGYGCYGFNCYGNTGTYGCYGQAFYGHGHVYGGHGCYGSFGYYGCYGDWRCYGQIQGSPYHVTPAPGAPPGKEPPEKVPPPKKDDPPKKDNGDEVSNRGRLVVELPADAKLFIDGQPTKTPSATRVFQTPDLQPGETYYYVLRAEVVRNGQTLTQTQRVTMRPGQESRADFNGMDAAAVAQSRR